MYHSWFLARISYGWIILQMAFAIIVQASVMRVESDTFGDPIFQKGLQN
jgi:hypothetical protein